MGEMLLFDDTPIEVERILVAGYRRMSAARKIERVRDLNWTLRAMTSRLLQVASEDPPLSLPIATAEDTVAHKLYRFRQADERSEKQWRDLVGVLKTLGSRLDESGLRRACEDLGVADLVDPAREAAGLVESR